MSPQSAAGVAGVRAGDIVLSVDGVKVATAQQAIKLLTFSNAKQGSFR